MNFFNPSMSLVENAYYLSGSLICLFALIGLYQLFLSKNALKINSKRQAATLSAQQINFLFQVIIPAKNQFDSKKDETLLIPIKKRIGKEELINFLKTDNGFSLDDKNKISNFIISVKNELSVFFNLLEGFSIYFIGEVADEEIAYNSVASMFIDWIEDNYLTIALLHNLGDELRYSNMIELYYIWKSRKLNKEYKPQPKKINPIGTR